MSVSKNTCDFKDGTLWFDQSPRALTNLMVGHTVKAEDCWSYLYFVPVCQNAMGLIVANGKIDL